MTMTMTMTMTILLCTPVPHSELTLPGFLSEEKSTSTNRLVLFGSLYHCQNIQKQKTNQKLTSTMDQFNTANMNVSVFANKAGVNPRRLPEEEIELLMELIGSVSDSAYRNDSNMNVSISFPNQYLHPTDTERIQSAVESSGGTVHLSNSSMLLISTEDGWLVVVYLNGSLKGFKAGKSDFDFNRGGNHGDDCDDDSKDRDDGAKYGGNSDNDGTGDFSLTQEITF